MKKVIRKMGAFLMALAVTMGCMASSAKVEAYGGEEGTITVKGVTEGNCFVGYKVIDVDYNSESNTVSYRWANGDIEGAVQEANGGVLLSVEEFGKIEDEAERQKLMAKVPALMNDDDPDLTKVTAASGSVTWGAVALGGYLIVPTATDEVYQVMVAIVQPGTDKNNEYETQSVTLNAKKTPLDIDKTVDDETTGESKKVTFTINADVPSYPAGAADTYYGISDKIDAGLTILEGTIGVYGVTEDGAKTSLTKGEDYQEVDDSKLKGQTEKQTFAYEFVYDHIKSYKKIKIVYEAKVNEGAVIGGAGNHNSTEMVYSHYPFQEDGYSTKDDQAEVYTYALKLVKVDAAKNETTLSGAEFDIYRKFDNTIDSSGDKVKTPPEALPENPDGYLLVGHMGPTDKEGVTQFERLDLGTYYLVETVAPNGYKLPTTAFQAEVTREGSTSENGWVTTTVTNTQGILLPQTGGMGTVVFTVCGVAFMAAAVLFLVVGNRKRKKL